MLKWVVVHDESAYTERGRWWYQPHPPLLTLQQCRRIVDGDCHEKKNKRSWGGKVNVNERWRVQGRVFAAPRALPAFLEFTTKLWLIEWAENILQMWYAFVFTHWFFVLSVGKIIWWKCNRHQSSQDAALTWNEENRKKWVGYAKSGFCFMKMLSWRWKDRIF